jgi:hypothetical protein
MLHSEILTLALPLEEIKTQNRCRKLDESVQGEIEKTIWGQGH